MPRLEKMCFLGKGFFRNFKVLVHQRPDQKIMTHIQRRIHHSTSCLFVYTLQYIKTQKLQFKYEIKHDMYKTAHKNYF